MTRGLTTRRCGAKAARARELHGLVARQAVALQVFHDPAGARPLSDPGRPQHLRLSRRAGMDTLVAPPREGVLTQHRFPLSGVLGTVRP